MQIHVPINAAEYAARLAVENDPIALRGRRQATTYFLTLMSLAFINACFELLVASYYKIEIESWTPFLRLFLTLILGLPLIRYGSRWPVILIFLVNGFILNYCLYIGSYRLLLHPENRLVYWCAVITAGTIAAQTILSVLLFLSKSFERYNEICRKQNSVKLPNDAFGESPEDALLNTAEPCEVRWLLTNH